MGDTRIEMFPVPVKDLGLEKISPLVDGIVGNEINDLDEAQKVLDLLNEAQKRLAEKVFNSQPVRVQMGSARLGTSILAKMPNSSTYIRFQIKDGKVSSYNFNTSETSEIYGGKWDKHNLKEAVTIAVSGDMLYILVRQIPRSDSHSLGFFELLMVSLRDKEHKVCIEGYRFTSQTDDGMILKAQAIKELFLDKELPYIKFADGSTGALSTDIGECMVGN